MPNINYSIAKRYLFGKKSTNLINIITGISIFGISIGTAALILILSVFNGLEGVLTSLFNPYNPDLKITPTEGKFFEVSDHQLKKLSEISGILAISKTLEEVCLFEYKGSQEIGIIKGVDDDFVNVTRLDTVIKYGNYKLFQNGVNYCVVEEGIRNKLSLNIDNALTPMMAFMPMRKNKSAGTNEFISKSIYPSGMFNKTHEDSQQYVITSIELVRKLLQQDKNMVTTLQVKMNSDSDENDVKKMISRVLGPNIRCENKYEQDAQTLRMIAIEKWIGFLITGLTLFLISFNLLGALWMIVLDKQKDLTIFKSFGYTKRNIRNLIITLGMMITTVGMSGGFIIGLSLYFAQKKLGIIGMPAGMLIEAYPVQLRLFDFLIVVLSVLTIGLLASLIPSYKASSLAMKLKS